MLNVLNCLLNCNNINKFLNVLDINVFYVYNSSVIIMLKDFSKHVWKMYEKNVVWVSILKMLYKSKEKLNVNFVF